MLRVLVVTCIALGAILLAACSDNEATVGPTDEPTDEPTATKAPETSGPTDPPTTAPTTTTTVAPSPSDTVSVSITGSTSFEGSGSLEANGTGFAIEGSGKLGEHQEFMEAFGAAPVFVADNNGAFALSGACTAGQSVQFSFGSLSRNVLGWGLFVLEGTVDSCESGATFSLSATMTGGLLLSATN